MRRSILLVLPASAVAGLSAGRRSRATRGRRTPNLVLAMQQQAIQQQEAERPKDVAKQEIQGAVATWQKALLHTDDPFDARRQASVRHIPWPELKAAHRAHRSDAIAVLDHPRDCSQSVDGLRDHRV